MLFNNVESFRNVIACLSSLVFVPPTNVIEVYEKVIMPVIEEGEEEWIRQGYEDETKDFFYIL